jgi:hypothetical protein
MVKRATRKVKKTLGKKDKLRIEEFLKRHRVIESQIIHTISQLHRFVQCFKTGDTSRVLQFGFNLGRLVELTQETINPHIWWKPIEKLYNEKNWNELEKYIAVLKNTLGVEYDQETLDKGC